MPIQTMEGPFKSVSLQGSLGTGCGYSGTTAKWRAVGLGRFCGQLQVLSTPQSAGFPLIRQTNRAATVQLDTVLPIDSAGQYPFDVDLVLPYVQIVTDATNAVDYFAQLVPGGTGGGGSGGQGGDQVYFATDIAYTSSITQNNGEMSSTTILTERILIRSVTVVSLEQISWFVGFYNSATLPGAGVTTNTCSGSVQFDAAEAVNVANWPTTNQFVYTATGLAIPYQCDDGTLTLATLLSPRDRSKAANAIVKIAYQPLG